MSFVGRNIKKIRSLKKLSQADFAKLFDLTRGTIGAYEEGRAEPKIDTIIHLANYFGLSIDAFLNKELTVSDLYSLDLVNEKLNEAHLFKKEQPLALRKSGIGLVRIDNYLEYIVNHKNKDFILNLPGIEFPVNFRGNARAFELNGSEMEYHQNGLHHGDILLCQKSDLEKKKTEAAKVYVLVTENQIIVRRLKSRENENFIFVTDDPNYDQTEMDKSTILELWEVRGVYSTYLNPPKMIDERVMMLEKKMEDLINKMN